jgi:N-acetylglucosaminyldiphosphoundecaprenol N-acetyl-beta-D-mannosaminyltransferase
MEVMGYHIITSLADLPASLPFRQAGGIRHPVALVNTLNPHSYVVAKRDPAFQRALKESSCLVPDGSGIVLAAAILKRRRIRKIAGADLHDYLLKQLDKIHGTCFYLGASQKTLDLIKARLATEYPNIRAGFYSPPYKPEFSDEDNRIMVEVINTSPIRQLASSPIDAVFIGMTAPKQEKWAFANRERLNVRVICSIGAVFDFYAGTVQRSSPFWISLGLEWLPRLLREPRRLWKRVFLSGPEFLLDLFLYLVRIKKP